MVRRIYHIALFGLYATSIITCSPPNNTSYGGVEDGQSSTTISSISYLKGIYNGYSYYISSDIIIEGVITANNAFGEYPSSIVIEDTSGAIEILCDLDCVTYGFVVGATVKAICSGLYIGSVGGMQSIGGAPYDQTPTSTLSEEEVASHIRICDNEIVDVVAKVTTIAELTTADILCYVEIKNLHFVITDDSILTFCSRDADSGQTQYTTHILEDEYGEQISLSVDREVEYADTTLPLENFDIYAIVECFNEVYSLRIVNRGY